MPAERRTSSEARAGRLARIGEARLYLILRPDAPWRDVEESVRRSVAGGVQVVQLRDKTLPWMAVAERAVRLARLGRELGFLSIVNDLPEIVPECGADGAHLGQEDAPPAEARACLGSDPLLGVSTHDPEQARRAARHPGVDYLGFGPIHPTATKGVARGIGTKGLHEVLREVSLPVFALGGIDANRLDDVLAAGGRRVAVSAAILDAPDPTVAARELRERLDRAAASGAS